MAWDSCGLNVHHFEYEPEAFPIVAEVRVGWVRFAAWWRFMQPQPPPAAIDYGYLELSVNAARAHGLKVLIVFASIPGWANGTPPELGIMDPNAALPPTSPKFFQDFVTAVVAHFKGRVDAYEIWNEPNYKTFWNSKDYDRFLAEILISGAQAVKAADPNAKTLGPATDRSPAKFKAAAIKACGQLDALSCHLYVKTGTALLQQLDDIYHPILVSQCNKPLWVTELGFDSWEVGVGEDVQAKELVAVLQGLGSKRPYLERLFIFQWRDGNWPYPGQKGWGLVSNVIEGFRRKKSFWAVQDLALQRLRLPGVASSPQPSDGGTNVPLSAPLVWKAGRGALSHRVYLGTESPEFQGAQTGRTFPASAREYGRTYFWRVDEVGKNGTTTGSTWRFTVEEDPAATDEPVIVNAQEAKPLFVGVAQGEASATCALPRSLVLPGTPQDLAKGTWSVAEAAADLYFLIPVTQDAPDLLTFTLTGLRPGRTYRVFGRFVTLSGEAPGKSSLRLGLTPATMTLFNANSPGAEFLRQGGVWEEREVLVGPASAEGGNLQVLLDGQGTEAFAGWSGLRLELETA